MESVKNKVALITGGSKGIGFGIAKVLAEAGMKIAITGRDVKSITEAAAQISGEVLPLVSDVKDFESQEIALAKTLDRYGQLDLLVANAGIGYFASIEEMEIDKWHDVIDTNVNGVFYSIKAAAKELIKTKGMFITISSLAGTNFFAGGAAYNASKFAVTGFTQAVMLDLRKHGVRCSTIMPGSVSTYFNEHKPSDLDAWKIQVEDIGEIVLDLMEMHPRTLPSKIEVRPSMPPSK